jgi:hypothetical protein
MSNGDGFPGAAIFCLDYVIANNRYPLPVEKFDWKRVDSEKGINLRIPLR